MPQASLAAAGRPWNDKFAIGFFETRSRDWLCYEDVRWFILM